jgi:isoquinoline 1-oxidoreductase beta subunit
LGHALPDGTARGIAVHESFKGFCAQVAEVSLDRGGNLPVVKRVVAAIDCGLAVNPDQVKAQVEGAVAFGLSATLRGQITFADGKPVQSNFHDFPILTLARCRRSRSTSSTRRTRWAASARSACRRWHPRCATRSRH